MKPFKSKNDWIEIGVDYFYRDQNSLTQKDYARLNGLNYKTFNNNVTRYRSEIQQRIRILRGRDIASGKSVPVENRVPLSIAEQFRNSYQSNRKILSKTKSARWFADTVRSTMRTPPKRATVNTMTQGKLYTYAYDPLTKARLPYWDQFPLIIFLEQSYGETTKRVYFRGLNLHYISPSQRIMLMEELLTNNASTSNLMKNTRLNIDWTSFKHNPFSHVMIKNYLPNHVRSMIREIPPSEWLNIISLPYQKFTDSDFDSNEEELTIY